MAINKTQLLQSLKADLKASEVAKKDQDGRIEQWKREGRGEPYGNEKKGKSQIVSRDIHKQNEWLHPTILDPFVSSADIVKVTPVTWEDASSAKQSELLLNYQFCRQFDRYNFMSKALKVAAQEGTVIVQCGWDYEDKEVEVEVAVIDTDIYGNEYVVEGEFETITETQVLKNQPTAVVCRSEDIYIDPTCMDDMDKCQFVIHRYETDLSALKADGRYKNLEKVAKANVTSDSDSDFNDEDDSEFQFKDDPRKKILVYEYWGNYDVNGDGVAEPIVCAWVGDIIIRLQSNPYPDKKPPFLVMPFNSVPFQMYGEADAELISDNQKIKTAIKRGVIDNMAQSNNGQVGVRKGALDAANRKKWLAGQNFEFNGTPNDFWFGSYNQISNSAFDMMIMQDNEIESLTAVKSFTGGISGNSLGSTATGVRSALDATSVRRLNRVRNISENLVKPLMRKWLAYSAEFLSEEEVIRVTNDEFAPIRRDDLAGKVDLEINVSTAEDNATKSQELSFLLQTVGPNEDPTIRREIMAQIMELMKMPDQAKKVRDYQPQPDPMQQQLATLEMEKLRLENEKIQAEIAAIYSGAQEDDADRFEKIAQAQYKLAQTRKLESEADVIDQKFLHEDTGVSHSREMEKEDFRRLADLDRMAFQKEAGDKNIGVR